MNNFLKSINQVFSKIKNSFSTIFSKKAKPHKKYGMTSPGAESNTRSARNFTPKTARATSKKSFFSSLNKKNFAIVVCAVAAAVVVPVAVVSANGAGSSAYAEAAQKGAAPAQGVMAGDDATAVLAELDPIIPDQAAAAEPEALPTIEPEATPTPKPYLDLIPDQTNADVVKLQQRLMELYYMDNDEPTELYGPITQQAVGYFQRKHGLPIDGVAGQTTQDLLFSDQAKPYTVTVGADGADVENIQGRLQELGYPVSTTGYFGTETESAVKYFQRMNGLTDDGSVGQYTKDVLFDPNAEPAADTPKKKPSSGSSSSGGSSGGGGGGSTSVVANPGSVEAFIAAAEALAGVPYVRGGKSSSGLDCSGFVYLALQNSGNGIGYMTSSGWAGSGYPTVGSMGELQRGDIVCFNGHVGIYLGGGGMIDASSGEGKVRYCSNIQGSSYWTKNFISGKRPL